MMKILHFDTITRMSAKESFSRSNDVVVVIWLWRWWLGGKATWRE
jgi:hypothetical protein